MYAKSTAMVVLVAPFWACSFDSQPARLTSLPAGSVDAGNGAGRSGRGVETAGSGGQGGRAAAEGGDGEDAGLASPPRDRGRQVEKPVVPPVADAGVCNLPACVRDLIAGCEPAGECTIQLDGLNVAYCYANGVHVQIETTFNGTQIESMATWARSDGRTCYSSDIEVDASSTAQTTQNLRNSRGELVATSIVDREVGSWTVTCKGGTPVVVNVDACSDDAPLMADGSDEGEGCELGTCD